MRADAALIIETDTSLSDEGYNISILDKATQPIIVRSSSQIGMLQALRTLSQLLAQFGRNIPAMTIDDEPAFPNRGVLLDVSRNRVPRLDELLRVARQLASWKINHLQLYTEHTFRYRGHNEVWRGASPLTPSDIRQLDHECKALGMTLAANQNCFGHMTRWLKHPRYAPLAEKQGDWEWEGRLLPGSFSLCPTDPGSIALVEDLLDQLLPNFSSGLVNIGCDETLDVGQGRSKEDVLKRGRAALYFEFVEKIAEFVKKRHFKPMFWADIALSHPEELHKIPPGMISLAWGYEPDAPFGEWCDRLRDAGAEVWVCPGTSSWRSITGRTSERRENLRAAVEQGLVSGATGLLMTDWGDEGHRQQWPVSLVGLAEAADAAWSGRSDPPDDQTLDHFLFGKSSANISAWLGSLGDADLPLRKIYGKPAADGSPTHLRNSSMLYLEMHRQGNLHPTAPLARNLWEDAYIRIKELAGAMPPGDAQTTAELALTAEVATIAASIGLLRADPRTKLINRKNLANRLARVISEHRRLWLLRSRPGELAESVTYYRAVQDRIRREFA